ncbi:MAG: sigma-70 family RNA polymerase sigma factor [Verrucomicrobiales bacterium]|nr:sigma-70 family RNA polymerase sigma factor [Verrucomicrobiales bacterium]
MNDWELIERYVRHEDEVAFSALVRRHAGLVHATAKRLAGPPVADDVSQLVFLLLSRKASSLDRDVVLPAWLYRATCHLVAQLHRREARRRKREREAVVHASRTSPEGNSVEAGTSDLDAHLDAAIAALPVAEQSLLVHRFFARQRFTDLGSDLGITEEAAKKRVQRALLKLRDLLQKQGILVAADVLAGHLQEAVLTTVPDALLEGILSRVKGGEVGCLLELDLPGGGGGIGRAVSERGRGAVLGAAGALLMGALIALLIGRWAPPGEEAEGGARSSLRRERITAVLPGTVGIRARPARAPLATTLRLSVVDALSGRPIAGALVEERRVHGETSAGPWSHPTDEAGSVEIGIQGPWFERLELRVVATAYVPVDLRWQSYEFEHPTLNYECRLSPGVTFTGRVVDEAGQPVPGATVRCLANVHAPVARRESGFSQHEVVTDAAGGFQSDQVPEIVPLVNPRLAGTRGAPTLRVIVSHPEFLTEARDIPPPSGEGFQETFVLRRGTSFRGVVVDPDDVPVVGARVRVAGAGALGEVVSDALGEFSIPHAPSSFGGGSISFEVNAGGFRPYSGVVMTALGAVDRSHFDAEGVLIGTAQPNDDSGSSGSSTAVHRASLDEAPGSSRPTLRIRLHPGPSASRELGGRNLQPEGLRLTGRVVDGRTGEPASRFQVTAFQSGSTWRCFLGEGRDGMLDWDLGGRSLPGFSVQMGVEIAAEGFQPWIGSVHDLAEGGSTPRITLASATETRAGVKRDGWIELPDTRAAGGAGVIPGGLGSRWNLKAGEDFDPQLDSAPRTVADVNGRFLLELPEVSDALQVLHPDGCALFPLDGAAEGTVIRLEPWARVEGVLAGADGSPLPGLVRIGSEAMNGGSQAPGFEFTCETTVDSAGRFVFERVPPGRHRVRGTDVAAWVEARSGATTEVRLQPR